MTTTQRSLSIIVLFTLLTLAVATPAYAFDGRGGETVIIKSGQVINDDLYASASEVVLDGTVNGDMVAFGQTVTVNGVVNGDLITAAQTVVVNGTVTGSVRMAGSVLFVGDKASINGDIVAAGYSLEVRQGARVGRDAVFATGQTLLAADIGRNVQAYTGGLEIDGDVAGNVKAYVGEAGQSQSGPPPTMFMGQSTVPVPMVKPGLSIDPEAKIAGSLEYTQNADLTIPAGVVVGTVSRVPQPEQSNEPAPEKTTAQKAAEWALNSGRSLVALVLIGLLLLWLFPLFMGAASDELRSKPWFSLGWGAVAWAGTWFLVLVTLFAMVFGAIVFGALTLGNLSVTLVFLGLLALFAIIMAFVLVTSFVAKVVFGITLGRWILTKLNSPIANHRYWPMVIGLAITVVVIAVLSFPLIPGLLGWLLDALVILFGMGALLMWMRRRLARPTPVAAA